MRLKCTKSAIEPMKQFNLYYFVRHNRLNNSIANCTDNQYLLYDDYWLKYKLTDIIEEAKLYELLKTEFKDNILYIDNVMTYRYLQNNEMNTIEIFYPFNGDLTSAEFTVANSTMKADNISNLTDIIQIINYLKGNKKWNLNAKNQ